jgi:hypothetical protein
MLLPVVCRYGVRAARQQCPRIDRGRWWCRRALCYPWQGREYWRRRRRQAGPRRQDAGTVCRQYVVDEARGAIARRQYRRSRRAGAPGGKSGGGGCGGGRWWQSCLGTVRASLACCGEVSGTVRRQGAGQALSSSWLRRWGFLD